MTENKASEPLEAGENQEGTEEPSYQKKFEYLLVDIVSNVVEKQGGSHSAFGKEVFGAHSGIKIWLNCRKHRRDVTVAEAMKMAEVIGTDLPDLVWKVTKEAKDLDIISK